MLTHCSAGENCTGRIAYVACSSRRYWLKLLYFCCSRWGSVSRVRRTSGSIISCGSNHVSHLCLALEYHNSRIFLYLEACQKSLMAMSCLSDIPPADCHHDLVIVLATLRQHSRESLESILQDGRDSSNKMFAFVYCIDNRFQRQLEQLGREGMWDTLPNQRTPKTSPSPSLSA